jgi:hypothetical protein
MGCKYSLKSKKNYYQNEHQISKLSQESNILELNFESYINKPIDSLISNQFIKEYTYYSFIDEPTGCLWFISFRFKNYKRTKKTICVNVYIYNNNLLYIKNCKDGSDDGWNFNLLKKELIRDIRFQVFE